MASVPKIFKSMEYGRSTNENIDSLKLWLKKNQFGPFINGKCVEGGDDIKNIIDPSTGDILSTVRTSSNVDIDNAVASCVTEHRKLAKEDGPTIMSNFMHKVASLLERDSQHLAEIEALNNGYQVKHPLEIELPSMVKYFTYYGNCAQIDSYGTLDLQSWPVVVAITNVNTPLLALAMLLAPAFAAQCCVCLVVPSEVSLSALIFARICAEASGSSGILNVLPGNQSTIDQIIAHKDVSKVLCFGSTNIVRQLRQKMSGSGNQLTALMSGGKTPMLVFESADLVAVVETAVQSAWSNQGTVPWATKMLLVEESVFNKVVEMLKTRLITLRVGNPFDKLADFCRPCNSSIAAVVARARQNGIQVFQAPVPKIGSTEQFYPFTLLIGGHAECNKLWDDEESVPVVTVTQFRTASEAIDLANNTRYGLAASIWSASMTLSLSVADRLKVGTVWINEHGLMNPAVPFAGWRESGIGSFGYTRGISYEFMKDEVIFQDEREEVKTPHVAIGDESLPSTYQLFYGGSYKNAEGNKYAISYLESKSFAYVAQGSSKDVQRTLNAAIPAQKHWAAIGWTSRAKVLNSMASSLSSKRAQLLSHMTLVKKDNPTKVFGAAVGMLKFWAAKCALTEASSIDSSMANITVKISKEPLGIIAIVWDHRGKDRGSNIGLLTQVVSAICYGNAVVVVVDSSSPTLELEFLRAVVGSVPAGVINVLTGKTEILAESLAKHQNVDAIWSLNCRASVAKNLVMNASQDMKRTCFSSELNECSVPFIESKVTQPKAIWLSKGLSIC